MKKVLFGAVFCGVLGAVFMSGCSSSPEEKLGDLVYKYNMMVNQDLVKCRSVGDTKCVEEVTKKIKETKEEIDKLKKELGKN
ncbi:hypothetical protein ACJY7S_001688 [Campylobacter upsaliensis]|uniref:hypothetical protein n=1 Tax=Campylobacter upsaliensis TaxID=28080 RepID=UPI001278C1F5|nr:hypothetical protein [Campylobacter upsaliensis]EAH7598098.1 hypothetical protein [Campylobacter upsaliensis]EAI3918248.1 hypothetical protein [Campylobacter upsaliensis]EAI8565358.1 hypothetical protein [Campylobacter upsaliensis]EAJ2428057.1 hypothetical protein [Campylobacter upsaliensis]EAJ7019347.1 hypothetical protein [Campylobacter upsaliensis]